MKVLHDTPGKVDATMFLDSLGIDYTDDDVTYLRRHGYIERAGQMIRYIRPI